jgi:hypothetical protein
MNNPFTSRLYTSIWLKHFKSHETETKFEFIEKVSFYKAKYVALYINIGRNLTKGLDYSINYLANDYKGKVFLIYDVPEYFKLEKFKNSETNLKLKKIYQYKGFALDFNDFETPEDYVNSRISSKNRRGYRSRLKRLETCFDIKYDFLFGEVNQIKFDELFKQFHSLLSKRFSGKGVNYHHLEDKKWHFYKELVYKLLSEKQASLFTIYSGDKPIGITLNFHSEDIAFVTITVFDSDYFKFNVGKASIVKLLEWSYEQNIKIMDFSKGEFDFKYEWCNLVYDFKYHVLYDSKSIKASLLASIVEKSFKLKLYLREKNVNILYRKLLHRLRKSDKSKIPIKKVNLSYPENFEINNSLKLLNLENESYQFLKKFVYSFLFSNPQSLDVIKIYKDTLKEDYYINGSKKTQLVSFTS